MPRAPSPRQSPAATPLTQGIALIRLMVRSGYSLGVTQIAHELGMPKSSTFRLLRSLVQLGFVQRIEQHKRYMLSADIFEFVHEIASHFGRNLKLDENLRRASQRIGCSVYICMLGRHETYVICGAGDEANTTRLGQHGPAHSSSVGKVLISQLPESEWMRYSPIGDNRQITPYTNRDPAKFIARIREARKNGLAWNLRETDSNIVSLATTIREPFIPTPRLAVALVMRQEALIHRDTKELETALKDLATELETQLGQR